MTKPQFVIIGGGIHGCAAAWMLADAGEDVLLLEADGIASGASGGFGRRGVRGNRRDLRELPLMRSAYRLWPTLSERLGADTGYERTGGLNLIEQETTGTKGGLVAARAHAEVQNRNGVPTEVLARDRVLELEPDLGEAIRGALYCPFDGTADHGATTAAFAAAARARGAVIREHSPVTGVEVSGGRAAAVTTADGRRHEIGRALLVLNNAGAPDLLRDHFGVTLPVWRILPQALRVQPPAKPPMRHLIGHDHRSLSLKPLPDGGVMVSGGWRGRWNAELGRGEAVDANVQGNLRTAAEVYADLADARVELADAARPESCSADEIPVIDRVPGTANALVGTGWTGHGFAIAPAVAEALAFWVRTGARPESLSPFTAARF
ncbi:NAD(P)/FAD-dependent oxidoreductase [Streptomonospora wellingtoniae]|uniref:FAD-binding oxidoreductase n=1 Tax=Streptomonospora wellingtoniae TaxID=3075544 RepID=A0ABU2KW04_9ACTN|nr:FAD-binding oxidoreductase [Streptomonospora sp. DSM 45055]MDT0303475.1 FAD-binding oxidoreductase [Streptomonospora sp. DSM 45055]